MDTIDSEFMVGDQMKKADLNEVNPFPSVLERVKAILTDIVISISLMFGFGYVFDIIEGVNDTVRMISFILIFVVYDPITVALIGGTPGHLANNLIVRKYKNQDKKINIIAALFRYLFKVILGWLSFLTVSTNPERRAVHDLISGSIVIYKNKV